MLAATGLSQHTSVFMKQIQCNFSIWLKFTNIYTTLPRLSNEAQCEERKGQERKEARDNIRVKTENEGGNKRLNKKK